MVLIRNFYLYILLLIYCSAVMAITSYELKVKHKKNEILYTFLAEVVEDVEEGWGNIRVGSSRWTFPCVTLTLDLTESATSELQDFVFDKRCADANDLQNGREGTVIMLLTALEFMYHMFPSVLETEFSDKSVIPGARFGGGSVSLADYYFLKSGKTWYETHFGAIPTLRAQEQILRNSRDKLTQIVSLPLKTFVTILGLPGDTRLVSVYEWALHKQNWLALFARMALVPISKAILQERAKRILRLLDIPSLAASSWVLPKATITAQTSRICDIISIMPTSDRLGHKFGIADGSSVHMHAGHYLGVDS